MMSAVEGPRKFRSRLEIRALQYTGTNRPSIIDHCEAWIDDKDRFLVRVMLEDGPNGSAGAIVNLVPGDWVIVDDGQCTAVRKSDDFLIAFEPT